MQEVKPRAGLPGGALLSRGGEMQNSGGPESEISRVLPETEAGRRMRGDGKNESTDLMERWNVHVCALYYNPH